MNESTGPATSSEQTANQASGCVCRGKVRCYLTMLDMMMPSAAAGEHFKNAHLEFLKGIHEFWTTASSRFPKNSPKEPN